MASEQETSLVNEYIQKNKTTTLIEFVASLQGLTPENRQPLEQYIQATQSEIQKSQEQLQQEKKYRNEIKATLYQSIRKHNSYCNGYLVKPPCPSSVDGCNKYADCLSWSLCCPCMGLEWLIKCCSYCSYPFDLIR